MAMGAKLTVLVATLYDLDLGDRPIPAPVRMSVDNAVTKIAKQISENIQHVIVNTPTRVYRANNHLSGRQPGEHEIYAKAERELKIEIHNQRHVAYVDFQLNKIRRILDNRIPLHEAIHSKHLSFTVCRDCIPMVSIVYNLGFDVEKGWGEFYVDEGQAIPP